MATGSVEGVELFGTLRLPTGGKNGYVGVRGSQGKQRDKFQAYATVDGRKQVVPGLHDSAHKAAVALTLWKQQLELGLEDAASTTEQKPRARCVSLVAKSPYPTSDCPASTPLAAHLLPLADYSNDMRMTAVVTPRVTVAAYPVAPAVAAAI